MSLRTGLVEAWRFAEGGGSSVAGELGVASLALSRTDRATAEVLAPGSGWTTEAYPSTSGRKTYNGAALATFAPGALLPNDGDVLTVAFRYWYGGGQIMDGWPFASEVPHPYATLLGMGGYYIAGDFSTLTGLRLYDTFATNDGPGQVLMQGHPSTNVFGIPEWQVNKGTSPFVPRLVLVEFTRVDSPDGGGGPFARARFGASGSLVPDQVNYLLSDLDLQHLMFGGHESVFGSISQAAVWRRALSPSEITAMGDDLDDLFAEIDAENLPLVTADGKSRVVFSPDNPRGFHAAVVRSSGGDARPSEARFAGAIRPRGYTMRIMLGSTNEINALRSAVASSGSTTPVRLSHPRDDSPASADDAPRYLIRNADTFTIERNQAGAHWSATLELEEVL